MRAPVTILLVDDDDLVRGLVRKVLDRDGYEVLEASSGPDALRAAEAHRGRIDLVLTDVTMPGMTGYELAARLSARPPAPRVLYMSAWAAERVPAEERLLAKPFTLAALGRAVRDALAESRAA